MFVRNNWYVAAFSSDLGTAPLARRICGSPIVIFRTASGKLAALEDRCAHRGVPLSENGECMGETLRCPYHGLEFNAGGTCTRVPGQETIPAGLNITSYPVAEKDALVWIWPGNASLADPGDIVSIPHHSDAQWVWRGGMMTVQANHQLIVDNLLDLSHLQYVHRKTIGGDPEEESRAELTTRREEDTVYVTRWLREVKPSPIHRLAKGYTEPVDRWQEFEFKPGVLRFNSGAAPANTGALEEKRRDDAMHIGHFHGVTPETASTSLYFFSSARNFGLDNDELTKQLYDITCATFAEDKGLLEAQQARLNEEPNRALMTIRTDVGIVQARKIIAERLAKETPAIGAAANR